MQHAKSFVEISFFTPYSIHTLYCVLFVVLLHPLTFCLLCFRHFRFSSLWDCDTLHVKIRRRLICFKSIIKYTHIRTVVFAAFCCYRHFLRCRIMESVQLSSHHFANEDIARHYASNFATTTLANTNTNYDQTIGKLSLKSPVHRISSDIFDDDS